MGGSFVVPAGSIMTDELVVTNWEEIPLMSIPADKDAVICLDDIGEWEIVPGSVESPE